MNRGGGRRVVEALDSPHTSKGCIMRSSLMSLFFWTKLDCTAYSLQVLQMCCVRQNVWFCCLPLKGLFWTSVGGVQVVHLMAKAQTIYSRRRAWVPLVACAAWGLKSIFSVTALRVCVSIPSKRGKKTSTHLKHVLQAFVIFGFHQLELSHPLAVENGECFLVWNRPSLRDLSSYSHGHTATHPHIHSQTLTLVHDWVSCCAYMLLLGVGAY